MVRSRTKKPISETQDILSPSERQSLEDQKRDLEDTLKEVENYGQGTSAAQIDKSALKRQIAHIDHEIESRTVGEPKGKTLDSLIRESRQLEEVLKRNLPTRYEMDHPAKCPGAVRKHMAWVHNNQRAIERWRYVQRVLNPEAPRSIEELREPGKPHLS